MALENTAIQDKLVATFGDAVHNFQQERDIFSFEVKPDQNTAVILFLKNDPELRFQQRCFLWHPDGLWQR